MYDLSIVIPARNEMFLTKTIEDILQHAEANTEVIVILDGAWADPVIPQHPRVTVLYHAESIGQRAACNEAVRLSSAKYVLKADAHCSFAQGFDTVLMNDMQDDWTVVPTMRNLWAFDWKCKKCGKRTYQGPTPTLCSNCGCTNRFVRRMVWEAKTNPQSNAYCFDSTPHFQYMKEYQKREEYITSLRDTGLTETMSLQGSCFMLTREKWWELGICDESFGSWGSQGIEVAVKTHFSGGRVVVNHKTFYAHLFRTSGADFSFPYPQSGNQVEAAKKRAKELIYRTNLPNQVHDLAWLLKKFWPVPGWEKIP
jgi:glycosyltransferase involved in cell wall biosynthesis